jgi:RecJ-like exonuclease
MKKNSVKKDKLLRLSTFISIIGILAIFVVKGYATDLDVPISEAENYMGRTIGISGKISSIYVTGSGHGFIELYDGTDSIKVVAFKSSGLNIMYALKMGDTISVLGKIAEYEGELEIIAKDIREV